MDRRRDWMYGSRMTPEFSKGVEEFRKKAERNRMTKNSSTILCPCRDCNNFLSWEKFNTIEDHLYTRGFKPGYESWYLHGEQTTPLSSNDCIMNEGGCSVRLDDGPNIENSEHREEENDMGAMLEVMDHDDESGKPEEVLESVKKAAETPLYTGCTKYSKLSAMLALFNIKATGGWSDKSFTALLELLADMLPEGNDIPKSTYYAKKLMCPLGLEYVKIHACPNDCILYRGNYENLKECPVCGLCRYNQKEGDAVKSRVNRSPAKVLWYLPVIPRFKRFFSIQNDANNMRWHEEIRKKDGRIRHPADAKQWKVMDRDFPDFGKDVRNLRLALCTDGMNPYGSQSTQHSSWPVVLAIYNLPPWLCMKRKYILTPLLIPGPKQPGDDIDVYLAPLIDDMKLLWSEGVRTYDAQSSTYFLLRAAILWTVTDFPAMGVVSGYKNKGEKACPLCDDDMIPIRLTHCKKNVYMHHRRHLRRDHPYRKKKSQFNGQVEDGVAREPLTGAQVYERVKDLTTIYGKSTQKKPEKGVLWKRRSILWELPYWKNMDVRHCLDVMHIEKNWHDALVGTVFNAQGKSKDSLAARKDMRERGIRKKLWPQVSTRDGESVYLPPACYTFSKRERQLFCECMHRVKVPTGYCSNIKRYVTPTELKFSNMKSHDCHVMMQVFIPIAIRGLLSEPVRDVIIRVCLFFNTVCRKVVDPTSLKALQEDAAELLCKFEMYFPPSFFDIMVHLIVHLPREIEMCGPVFLRWMYYFERHFKTLKEKTRNPARPEASIVQGLISEEIAEFCSEFIEKSKSIGMPTSRHEGRLQGKAVAGTQVAMPPPERVGKAHLYVLQNLEIVDPYVERHLEILRVASRGHKSDWNVMQDHNRTFVKWFKKTVMDEELLPDAAVSDRISRLAREPLRFVRTHEAYDMNGFTFHTSRQDERKGTVQNSGVMIVASSTEFSSSKDANPVAARLTYYGIIEEIWELDYMDGNYVAVFRCKWADNRRGRKNDKYGFTLVDKSKFSETEEPFVLASHVKQVFYVDVNDVQPGEWSIVVQGKRQIVGIEDVVDEDDYDQFDQLPPLSTGVIPTIDPIDEFDHIYMRRDLDEDDGITLPQK